MRLVRGTLAGFPVARGALLAPLPSSFWLMVKAAPSCGINDGPRCTCYVLPHDDDCRIFSGITITGRRWINPARCDRCGARWQHCQCHE